ncbi:MAG TPA: CsbD family protein [Vicinamibacterales bacterium]|nr:CsbD family protein [Vicinamibacterales bacterium]
MNRDELEGRKDQIKGKVKQGVGDVTDNERMHDEGVADEAGGEVQEGFGRGRRKVGEAIKDIGDRIKR